MSAWDFRRAAPRSVSDRLSEARAAVVRRWTNRVGAAFPRSRQAPHLPFIVAPFKLPAPADRQVRGAGSRPRGARLRPGADSRLEGRPGDRATPQRASSPGSEPHWDSRKAAGPSTPSSASACEPPAPDGDRVSIRSRPAGIDSCASPHRSCLRCPRRLTIMAGRRPQSPAWLTTPGGGTSSMGRASCPPAGRRREVLVDAASTRRPPAACQPLRARPAPGPRARGGRGLRERPDLRVDLAPPPKLVEVQLTQAFVADCRRRDHQAVERRLDGPPVTEPASSAGLAPASHGPRGIRGASTPTFSPSPTYNEGLVIHDLVRETLGGDTAQRDSRPIRRLPAGAASAASSLEESQRAEGAGLWHPTADLLYLINNQNVREGFSPRARRSTPSSRPTSAKAAEEIRPSRGAEGPRPPGGCCAGGRVHPETFRIRAER